MTTPIITAVLTILGGICIYVSGQVISKFFIEPYHDYRKTVGEIAYALMYYANVSARIREDIQAEAHNAFRQYGSRLRASDYQIPCYNWFARRSWTNLPPIESVMEGSAALIALSNAVYSDNYEHIARHRQKIAENLQLTGIN